MAMNLYSVFMPCVAYSKNTGEESYVALTYYVHADTPEQAEKIAESWLSKTRYDLDDFPSATPYDPKIDFHPDKET